MVHHQLVMPIVFSFPVSYVLLQHMKECLYHCLSREATAFRVSLACLKLPGIKYGVGKKRLYSVGNCWDVCKSIGSALLVVCFCSNWQLSPNSSSYL